MRPVRLGTPDTADLPYKMESALQSRSDSCDAGVLLRTYPSSVAMASTASSSRRIWRFPCPGSCTLQHQIRWYSSCSAPGDSLTRRAGWCGAQICRRQLRLACDADLCWTPQALARPEPWARRRFAGI